MKNAKINKNRPEISSNDINKTKDFDYIIKHSKKTFPYRKSLIIGGILSSFILIGIVLLNRQKEIQTPIKNNKVYSPINFDNNHEVFTIATDTNSRITTKDNSIIEIPSNAFMLNGQTVTDSVQLKFEKYTTIPEIFISQIPMTYDSANNQYHFESAGMFNISAYDFKGNKLSTNPYALISVKMSSTNSDNKFNQYYLNNDSNWSFITSKKPQIHFNDKLSLISKNKAKIEQNKKEINQFIEKNIPKIPAVANPNKYALNLKFEQKKFPELTVFNGVLFEINDKNIEENEISTGWSNYELIKENEKYTLKLYKKDEVEEYRVTPVIQKKDQKNATEKFKSLYADFEKENKNLFAENLSKIDSLSSLNKKLNDSIKNLNNIANTSFKELSAEQKLNNKVYRIFTINKFGTYNSDCPQNLPEGFDIESPIFVNSSEVKDTLKFHKIYLAEYGKNALYTLYENSYQEKVSFNPSKPTILWGITKNNKLATIELTKTQEESTLAMELHEINNETNADYIRKRLKWQ